MCQPLIILNFTTETGTTSISGELVGTPTPSQFKLSKNGATDFSVDRVEQMTDVSKVKVWVDYNKNTFDKIINKAANTDFIIVEFFEVDPCQILYLYC